MSSKYLYGVLLVLIALSKEFLVISDRLENLEKEKSKNMK